METENKNGPEYVQLPPSLKRFRPGISQGLKLLEGDYWPVLDEHKQEKLVTSRITLDDEDIEQLEILKELFDIPEQDILLSAILVADLAMVNYHANLTKELPESIWYRPLENEYFDDIRMGIEFRKAQTMLNRRVDDLAETVVG